MSEIARYLGSFLAQHEEVIIIDDVGDPSLDRELLEKLIDEFFEELP